MVTLYKLLGVPEDASKELIQKAYEKRMNHPSIDDKVKNKIRMAADILLNDAKREKYNKDLSNYRAQELLKNVMVSQDAESSKPEDIIESEEEKKEVREELPQDVIDAVEESKQAVYSDIFSAIEQNKNVEVKVEDKSEVEEVNKNKEYTSTNLEKQVRARKKAEELRQIEEKVNQKEYEKILKKQQALDKKQLKKAEKEYQERYQEAYVTELRNRGYDVKYPWTWKRTKNLLIGLIVTIVVCAVGWQIPVVNETLTNLYNENFFVKMIVDLIGSLLNAILSVFKSE